MPALIDSGKLGGKHHVHTFDLALLKGSQPDWTAKKKKKKKLEKIVCNGKSMHLTAEKQG